MKCLTIQMIFMIGQKNIVKKKHLIVKLAKSLLENEILLGEDICQLIDSNSEIKNSLRVFD